MNNKLAFGKMLNELSDNMPVGMTDCENYGMVDGCDPECPQFLRGECQGEPSEVIAMMDIEEQIELAAEGHYSEIFAELACHESTRFGR